MTKKYKSCVVIALSLAWLVLNPGVHAQWSTDPSENTRINYGGLRPRIVTDGKGGAIITSNGYGGFEQSRNIYIQRIDRYGYLRWGENGVPVVTAPNYQQVLEPRQLLSDGNGGAYIAWTDYRRATFPPGSPTDSTDVYVQHVDSNGVMLWEENGIKAVLNTDNRMYPKIVPDEEGGVIVVFYGESVINETFYAQRLSYEGERIWGDDGITVISDITFSEFDITTDRMGGFYFVYAQVDGKRYAQRLNGSGELMWGDMGFRVSIGITTSQSFPTIISDSSQNLIIQLRGRYWNGTESIYHLILQKLDLEGNRLWKDEGIILSDQITDAKFPHKMVVGENNGIYVGWFDNRPLNAVSNVQYFDSTGTASPKWNENTFGGVTLIDNDGIGGVIFRYSVKSDHDSLLSYTQHFYNGQTLWDSSGVQFSSHTTSGHQVGVSDGNGGVIITWYEIGLDTGNGVFAQQINQNGQLGEVILAIPNTDPIQPETFTLLPNYPNPFNPVTTIEYHLPIESPVRITVYNLAGQVVGELINEVRPAGIHRLNFDATTLASGMYFYQIEVHNPDAIGAAGFNQTRKMILLK